MKLIIFGKKYWRLALGRIKDIQTKEMNDAESSDLDDQIKDTIITNNFESNDSYTIENLINESKSTYQNDKPKCIMCKSTENVYDIKQGFDLNTYTNSFNLCEKHGIELKLFEIQSAFGTGKSVIDQNIYAETIYKLHVRKELMDDNETVVRLSALYSYLKPFAAPRENKKFTMMHLKKIEELEKKIPNAKIFFDHIKLSIYASLKKVKFSTRRINPVLLVGAPGVGKTHIMNQLANTLQINCANIQLSNLSSSMEFCGLPAKWKTPSIGIYARKLSEFKSHTAMILLDEIDKVYINQEHGSIFEALLILLETDTCSTFCDALIDLPMHSNDIFFVATANDLSGLPRPILSRFTIIEIKKPTPSQMINIINNIYHIETEAWKKNGYECRHIEDKVVNMIKNLSVRDVKKLISSSVNKAAYENRNCNKKIIHITRRTLLNDELIDELISSYDITNDTLH